MAEPDTAGPHTEKEAPRAVTLVGLSKPRQPLPPGPALAVLETAQSPLRNKRAPGLILALEVLDGSVWSEL